MRSDRTGPGPALTRKRIWLFRLITWILPPLLFLGALEGALRLGGYGYPSAFLVKLATRDAYSTNPAFGLRFFPRALARTPQPCYLAAKKPAEAYRIFVLGSSAALGIPKPAYGFSRVLEAMLDEAFPGVEFEVVNAAMTAINSNVALPIARDCARRDPDLFIVYMGNNEVIGPYGPGTVFERFSSSLGLVRAAVWFRATRTGQLLTDLSRGLGAGKGNPRAWGGMQMFLSNSIPADDPQMPRVYEHFEANLVDICRQAERHGAGTILCTVGTNLKDCPPFSSLHRRDLTPADRSRWQALFDQGIRAETAGAAADAAQAYFQAAAIDSGYAELQFRVARCLWTMGDFVAARRHFILAREWDALRFRADIDINRTLRRVAAREARRGVHLVDADSCFIHDERTLHEVPGRELFLEHVHMNWEGTHLLAAAVFRQVVTMLPDRIRRRAGPVVEPASPEQCAERLALTDRDRLAIAYQINAMMGNPPFTNQIDREQARERRGIELAHLRAAAGPEKQREAYDAYARAVERTPDDLYFREALAQFLYDSGQYERSVQEWRALLQRCPGVPKWRLELGRALSDMGRSAEAVEIFRELVREPLASVEAHNSLGLALERAGRIDEAMAEYRRAVQLDPSSVEPRYNLGLVFARQGKLPEAMREYSQALEADSSFVDAYLGIGNLLERQGRPDAAIAQYLRALRVNPVALNVAEALGVALARQGRMNEAIAQFEAIARLDPLAGNAYVDLGSALAQAGRMEEAQAAYRSALQWNPNLAGAHYGLGRLLADTGRDAAGAAQHLREAVRLAGDWVLPLNRLAELLATELDPRIRNTTEAIQLAEKATRLTQGRDPLSLQTLALSYAAAGRFDQAVEAGGQARELAMQAGDAALTRQLEQQLALYREGRSGAP